MRHTEGERSKIHELGGARVHKVNRARYMRWTEQDTRWTDQDIGGGARYTRWNEQDTYMKRMSMIYEADRARYMRWKEQDTYMRRMSKIYEVSGARYVY